MNTVMSVVYGVLLATFALAAAATSSLAGSISITAPKEGQEVPERPNVEGIVDDASSDVWVVLHPLEVSECWVQPEVFVHDDGSWITSIYVGRPGRADLGKQFQIRAVVNPVDDLKEGDIVRCWPEAEAQSDLVVVKRK